MNEMSPSTPYENNLVRLLKISVLQPDAAFTERMLGAVTEEVGRQRSVRPVARRRSRVVYWSSALAATAVTLVIIIAWKTINIAQPSAGKVRAVYGLVALEEDHVSTDLEQNAPASSEKWEEVQSGAWVHTRWGSRAEVLLSDRSRIFSRPQTVFRVENDRKGETIVLKQGWLSIEAAKQEPDKVLLVETPGARIAILGTKLDVHLVHKPDGRVQTRVSVAEGRVEMESGGKKILLPANTEGVADEGFPPQRRCLTPEVNELIRLLQWNQRLATQAGVRTGSPSIIEFQGDATAKLWSVVSLPGPAKEDRKSYSLHLKEDVPEAEAFTLEGSPLKVKHSGRIVEIQMPDTSAQIGKNSVIILKLSGMAGVFTAQGKGVFEFIHAIDDPDILSLVQFRLPESAEIEEIRPDPVENTKFYSRQSITVAAHIRGLETAACDD
jgi:ferric-dicitrate binding protein FerR (iron transport regulator)